MEPRSTPLLIIWCALQEENLYGQMIMNLNKDKFPTEMTCDSNWEAIFFNLDYEHEMESKTLPHYIPKQLWK